jgi:CheY-like chemotaxis protein
VRWTLVHDHDDFHKKLAKYTFSFIFIAHTLYEQNKEIIAKHGADSKIVLLTEFGETIPNEGISTLAMPVHVMSIANLLNGMADHFSYGESNDFVAKFTAPEAYVLIVDDISTNLNVAEGLLRPYEMQVTLCKSGLEALDVLAIQKYDLVFMDHMMPEMDGVETVRRVRASDDPYYKSVPIVALTANAVSGTKEMFMANGFNDFLSKPIDTIKLDTILKKWIPKEKQQKQSSAFESGIIMPSPISNTDLPNASFAIEIEGVDVKKGISMCGGAVENYKRILAIFYRDGTEKVGELKKNLATDNLPLYVTYVHALKSAAANIGANKLSEMAKALELAGNQGDMEFIQTYNAKLLLTLETLLGNINEAIKSDKREEHQGSVGMNLLKSELAKLAEAIDSVNPRAIKEAVRSVQPFAQITGIGSAVENILQKTSVCEYDEAIAMIKELLT